MAGTMQEMLKKKSSATAMHTRKNTTIEMHVATHDEIALRAHLLYEKSGYQSGRDVEFWLEAERQLRKGHNA